MELSLKLIGFSNEFYPKIGGISNYVIESSKTFKLLRFNYEQVVPYNSSLKKKYFPFKVKVLRIAPNQNTKTLCFLFLHILTKVVYYLNNLLFIAEPGPLKVFSLLNALGQFPGKCLLNISVHGSEVLQMKSLPLLFIFKKFLIKVGNVFSVSIYTKVLTLAMLKTKKQLVYKVKTNPPSVKNTGKTFLAGGNSTLSLMTVGRLHHRKGHLVSLNNIGNFLKFSAKPVYYKIIGPLLDKRYFKHVILLATKLKILSKLKMCAGATNLSREYFLNEIHLMTSVNYGRSLEGFGLVYIEANLRKLSVIANKIGGVGGAIVKQHTGFFINKNIHRFIKIATFFNKKPNGVRTVRFFSKLYSMKYRRYWFFIPKSLLFT